MKKTVYTTLLTTGLIASMTTQAFAAATIDPNAPDKNITVGSAVTTSAVLDPSFADRNVSVGGATTTNIAIEPIMYIPTIINQVEVTKDFKGVTPVEAYEVSFKDSKGNDAVVQYIYVFEKNEYFTNTRIARPTPYLTLNNKVYVAMGAKNTYEEGTEDFNNFNNLATKQYSVLQNQITDMSQINKVFSALFGAELDEDFLNNFIYIQDLKTDKMTVLKFDMYALVNPEKNEYDRLATFTLNIKNDVDVLVPIKMDTYIDPAFAFGQKLLLEHEALKEAMVINEGVAYLPVRTYGELAHYDVIYLPEYKTINFKKGNTKFITKYGSDTATKMVNGEEVAKIDIANPLYIVDGVGYAPISFFIDAINAK